jgi:hypothetical protein
MTEADWMTTPFRAYDMLRHVRSRTTARKLRLLACGCCRLISAHLSDAQRAVLAVVERHADGLAGQDEYDAAVNECGEAANRMTDRQRSEHSLGDGPEYAAVQAMLAVVCSPADTGLQRAIEWTVATAGRAYTYGRREANQRTQRKICDLFREVVGNPFAPRAVVGPEWVASGGGVTAEMIRVGETPRALAVGIQADQAFDRMPILADALEDDGCAEPELLAHLRAPHAHVRGCWALDLVLGKG